MQNSDFSDSCNELSKAEILSGAMARLLQKAKAPPDQVRGRFWKG